MRNTINFKELERHDFQKIYFGFAMLWYVCMWYNSVLFSQLNDPPFTSMVNDLTYLFLYKIHFFDLVFCFCNPDFTIILF